MTAIPIVISALGTLPKRWVKELKDLEIRRWVETIRTTAWLRSAKILRRVLETRGDMLSLRLQWKAISVSWSETLKWRPDFVIINYKKMRTCRIAYFAVPAAHWVKLKESEKRNKFLENWKIVEQESDDHTNCNWCSWYYHQRIDRRAGGFGKKRTGGDHRNYVMVEIGQNT